MSIKSKLSRWIDRALRMPTCEEVEALAYDFLEQNLDAKTERRMLRHFRLCPPCMRFIEAYRRTRDAGRGLPAPKLDSAFQEHLMKLFQKDGKS